MFRKVLPALVVASCAFSAVAAVVKIRAFTPSGPGETENPEGDGMAILHYNENTDETEATIHITDFVPNTTYGIQLESNSGGFTNDFAVTTNASGNATYKHATSLPFNRTQNARVTIYRSAGVPDQSVSPDEIRAIGTP